MQYHENKRKLLYLFKQYQFAKLLSEKRTETIPICKLPNGSVFALTFPGYKSGIQDKQLIYDYRLDLTADNRTVTLSHVNLIVDLYHKCKNCGVDPNKMRTYLLEAAREDIFRLKGACDELVGSNCGFPESLLDEVEAIHQEIGKRYNRAGNWRPLTIDELFVGMQWIVLQEDINYSMERGFEGRAMPFARYLEAIFVAVRPDHQLDEVIKRTLSHSVVSPWVELDYSFIHSLAPQHGHI